MRELQIIGTLCCSICLVSQAAGADPSAVERLTVVLEDPAARVESKRDACAKLCQMEIAAQEATGAVIKLAISNDSRLRAAGMETLGWIGVDLDRVVPILLQGLKDGEAAIRFKSAVALGQLGLDVVPVLIRSAKDESPSVRAGALKALCEFGGEAQQAAPVAIDALGDKDDSVRDAAESFLELLLPPEPATIKALSSKLDEDDKSKAAVNRKVAIVWLLASYGKAAAPALATLRKQLKATDRELSLTTAWALAELGEEKDTIRPILRDGLKKGAVTSRIRSAEALVQLGEKGEDLVPAFLEILDQAKNPESIASIWRNIAVIGAPAVPALVKLLEQSSYRNRADVVIALSAMGKDAKEATAALLRVLKDKDLSLVTTALYALPTIAEPTQEVLDALGQALKHDTREVRKTAAIALAAFGADAAAYVPAIVQAVKVSPKDEWLGFLYALAALGLVAKDARIDLESLMEKALGDDRTALAWALVNIDSRHETAWAALNDALKSAFTRRKAMALVGLLDQEAGPLRSTYEELLGDEDPDIQSFAVLALGRIGLSEDTCTQLCSMAPNANVVVRQAIALALGKPPRKIREQAIAALKKLLTDRSADVRFQASVALLKLDPQNKPAREKLRQCYGKAMARIDEGRYMARDAHLLPGRKHDIDTIGLIGPDAAPMIPVLSRIARRSHNLLLRAAAEEALNKVNREK